MQYDGDRPTYKVCVCVCVCLRFSVAATQYDGDRPTYKVGM